MVTLYAAPGSGNCFKPFLAMRQLAIPFKVRVVDVLKGETRSEAYRSVNPAAAVPYLRLPGGYGLGESNAMLWFIAAGSSLMPQEPYGQALGLQWMFFEQSKLEPFISPARFFSVIAPERGVGRENDIATWRQMAEAGLERLDAYLEQTDFIAGSAYSIADIGVFGYVHLSGEAGIDLDRYPSVRRWIGRVESTPRYVPIGQLCADAPSFLSKAA